VLPKVLTGPRAVVVLLLLLAAAGISTVWLFVNNSLRQPLEFSEQSIVVPRGVGVSWLSRELFDLEVLSEPYTIQILAYWRGEQESLKAGEYRFENGMTIPEVLSKVTQGQVVQRTVTFVEGLTTSQILAHLASVDDLTITLAGKSPEAIMSLLGSPDTHPEGQFFPETYFFTRETTDLDLLRQSFERMQDFLDKAWRDRDEGLPLDSPYEALILASIVEKETAQADERALIAGVFINRLRRRMKLQTDPTVIYGLGEQFQGNLRSRHLKEDTLYNTYTRYGLPPSPIALAGAEAIEAVLHPAKTDALFFVARGDGTHQFSNTLKSHNNAVIKYQLGGRPRNFSSNPGALSR
jgi:UPF0755 protein